MTSENSIEKKQDILLKEQNNYINDSILKFKNFNFCLIGCGGVGSQVAELLIRSGIKKITLIDRDVVEVDNLGRQNFISNDISTPKITALKNRLESISLNCEINIHFDFVTSENIEVNCNGCDIILDCSDNLEIRRIINEFSLKNKKIWVYSGGQGFESVVKIFDYSKSQKDLFSKLIQPNHSQKITCQDGVLNATTSITACLILNELLKYLCLNSNSQFIKFNSLHNSFFKLNL